MAWATATGAPSTLTDINGNVAYLISTNEVPLYVGVCNVEAAQTISTTNVWPGGSSGLSLNGTNRTLFMWDAGEPLVTHSEFTAYTTNSRVSILDPLINTNLADHSTAVAGTLVAGGVNNLTLNGVYVGPAAKGMSFAAKLQAGSFNDDIMEMTGEAGTNKMRLSNHSYEHITGWFTNTSPSYWFWSGYSSISTNADPKFGNYTTYSSNYDQLAYNAPTYLGVWASGNDTGGGPTNQPIPHYEYTVSMVFFQTNNSHPLNGDQGGYVTISDDGVAKDTLCVGAVWPLTNGYAGTNSVVLASFSSCGPTDDGRIKPDVVACGVNVITASASGSYEVENGTSFATPNVAGSINLLAEYYAQLHTNAADLLASTLKALVITTADQCGTNIGPSYQFGWGLMNTAKAASLIANDATNGLKCFIKEVMLSNDTTIQFPIQSSGTNALKVTIAWTDPPGVGNALTNFENPAIKLVNDLDLRVISPTGTTNFPYNLNPDLTNRTASARSAAATTGDNIRDNVEQVYIAAPTNGTYQVTVTHKGTLQNSAPQWVSIVSTGNTATLPPPFTVNTISQTGSNQFAVGWSSVVGQRYQVQYVTALSASNDWLNIGGQVSARLTNVVALLPVTNSFQTYYRVAQVP